MIITEKTKQVQFKGNFDTIKVGIDEKSISHFFRMISNLYQDPVMAVLREIGANCVDAAKEAGTEKLGWQLHLPSRMDGNVRFVDNGVGISHDQMIRIYSVIGASSKREDNNLIGGFGVGKWSLCALVNNFQAVSIYNGTRSTYFICLQSNGLPDIKVIKQEQTNERNGFEVKFMCPEKYIAQFNEKAAKAYRFFSTKPSVFTGGVKKELVYGTRKAIFSSKDTGVEIFENHGEGVVEMGGVGYRLPVESILENKKFQKFSSLLSSHIVIHAPIGEYSITPSREAIQLDDLTMTRLYTKLEKFVDTFVPTLQAQLDSFTGNTFDAKKKLQEVRSNFKFLPEKILLNWHGKPLTASQIDVKTAKVKSVGNQTYYKKIISQDEVKSIVVQENSFIFLDDLGTGGVGRCKHFITEKKKDGQSRYNSYIAYIVKKSEKDKFIKETGWIGEFDKTSSLPVPPKNLSVKVGGISVSAGTLRMRSEHSWGITECLTPIDIASDKIKKADQFILFPSFANKVVADGAKVTDSFINALSKFSGKKVSALFLTKKEYDAFNETELDGKPIIKIEEILKDQSFADYLLALASKVRFDQIEDIARTENGWDYQFRAYLATIHAMRNKFPSGHIVQSTCEMVKAMTTEGDTMTDDIRKIVLSFSPSMFKTKKESFSKEIVQIINNIKLMQKTYPLLDKCCDTYRPDSVVPHIVKYIKLMDADIKN